MFLKELNEKLDIEDAVFLVEFADRLTATLHRRSFEFRYKRFGQDNSIEHVFQEAK